MVLTEGAGPSPGVVKFPQLSSFRNLEFSELIEANPSDYLGEAANSSEAVTRVADKLQRVDKRLFAPDVDRDNDFMTALKQVRPELFGVDDTVNQPERKTKDSDKTKAFLSPSSALARVNSADPAVLARQESMNTPGPKRSLNLQDSLDVMRDEVVAAIEVLESQAMSKSKVPKAKQREALTRTSTAIEKLKAQRMLHRLDVDVGKNLLVFLRSKISAAGRLGLKATSESEDLDAVTFGFTAASIALEFFSSNEISKEVQEEELLEEIIDLTKKHLTGFIFPTFDPLSFVQKKEEEEEVEDFEDVVDDDGGDSATSKKRKKPPKKSANNLKRRASTATKEHKAALPIMYGISAVLSKLTVALESLKFQDGMVGTLSSLALSPFFVDGVQDIQLQAINVARVIFTNYEGHRESMIQEIFTGVVKLNKRKSHSYHIVGSKAGIQTFAALIMLLVQSCTAVNIEPFMDGIFASPVKGKRSAEGVPSTREKWLKESTESLENAMKTSMSCAATIISIFIKRCLITENRPIFDNFVDDLLKTAFLPEWPASELLLLCLCKQLVLSIQSSLGKEDDGAKATGSDKSRATALDVLGTVLVRLKEEQMFIEREPLHIPLKQTEVNLAAGPMDKGEVVRCICSTPESKEFNLMDCSECHIWFHSECVGMVSDYDGKWICPRCTIRIAVEHQEETLKGSVSEESVMKQLLVNYLSASSLSNPSNLSSRQFVLASWILEKDETVSDNFLEQWKVPPMSCLNNRTFVLLPRSDILKCTRQLSTKGDLLGSFDKILNAILACFYDSYTTCRATALKSLSRIVEKDPSMMQQKSVMEAVCTRLEDQSITVREAATKFVGAFVFNDDPEKFFESEYLTRIEGRLLDVGPMVRNRVIQILRDMALKQPSHPKVSEICLSLSTRLYDESEKIQELVAKTFYMLWFTHQEHDESALSSEEIEKTCKSRAHQIVSVVKSTGTKVQWLVDLFKKLLEPDTSQKERKTGEKICKRIVHYIVEMALYDEEAKSEAGCEVLLSALRTLKIFANSLPDILTPHAKNIYLLLKDRKSSVHQDMRIIVLTADLLASVVPNITKDIKTLNSLSGDLKTLIQSGGHMILPSCISCFCKVVKVTYSDADRKFIMGMLVAVKKFLLAHEAKAIAGGLGTAGMNFWRAILLASSVCRYFEYANATSTIESTGKELGQLFERFITKSTDPQIQRFSAMAFGSMCVRIPILLHDHRKMIASILNDEKKPELKQEIIGMYTEILAEEEAAILARQAKNEVRSAIGVKEEKTNEGMGRSFMMENRQAILELTLDEDSSVRLKALGLVRLMRSHGCILFSQVSAYLFALDADADASIRDKAHKLLLEFIATDKYSLETCMVTGIQLSYKLHSRLNEGVLKSEGRFERAYRMVNQNKSSYRPLLERLMGLFSSSPQTPQPFEYQAYLAQILACLPYQAQDEVLFVVYKATTLASLEGGSIFREMENLEKSLRNQINDESVATEQDLDGRSQWSRYARSALPMMVLLRLKKHLKSKYYLGRDKCKDYHPLEAVQGRVARPENNDSVNLTDIIALSKTDLNELENCVRVYKLFKTLFREDSDDYNDQAPTPRGKRRKSQTAAPPADGTVGEEGADQAPTPDPKTPRRRRSAQPSPKKAKRMAKRRKSKYADASGSDDDDDDDDDDYIE